MNTPYDTPAPEPHDPRLAAALDAIQGTPVPAAAIERVARAARAIPLEATAPAPRRAGRAATVSRRALALAAGLLALGIALVVVPGFVAERRAAAAFAEVVERAKGATSVRFASTQRFGPGRVMTGRQWVTGKLARFELVDGPLVMVFDLDQGEQLLLDTANKHFERSHTKEISMAVGDPVEQLARAAEGGVEPVAGEPDTFRGKWVSVLGMEEIPDMTVVVDHDSRLPTRIVISDTDPKHPFEVILDDFHWNEPVDATLFSLDPPEGYVAREGLLSLGSVTVAPMPPILDGRVIQDRAPAAIFWSADGTRLTTLVRDPEKTDPRSHEPNMLRQWDLATGELRWSENVAGAGYAAVTADGRFLADVVGYEMQLRSADTGAIERTWTTGERLGPLAFSPDGATLAAGIMEWGPYGGRGGKMAGGIEWWDVATGTLVRSIALDLPTTHLAFSPDGRFLAASSNDGPVRLVDATHGAEVRPTILREFPGRGPLAFSHDGQWLACAAAGDAAHPEIGRITLHPLADGAPETRSLATGAGRSPSTLLDLAFTRDDVALVSADWNGDVTLLELDSGRVVHTLRDHGDGFLGTEKMPGVITVQPSPDGHSLATGGEDGTVRLWSPGGGGEPVRDEER